MDGGTERVASCSAVSPLALELEGHPVAVEVLRKHGPLTPSGLESLSWIAVRLSPHAIEVHVTNQSNWTTDQASGFVQRRAECLLGCWAGYWHAMATSSSDRASCPGSRVLRRRQRTWSTRRDAPG